MPSAIEAVTEKVENEKIKAIIEKIEREVNEHGEYHLLLSDEKDLIEHHIDLQLLCKEKGWAKVNNGLQTGIFKVPDENSGSLMSQEDLDKALSKVEGGEMSKESIKQFKVEIEGMPELEINLKSMSLPTCHKIPEEITSFKLLIEGFGEFTPPIPKEIGTVTVDENNNYTFELGPKLRAFIEKRFEKTKKKTSIRIIRKVDCGGESQ